MLDTVLPAEAFGYLLVSSRLVALVMMMPVLGDQSIPTRVRISLGFLVSLVVYSSLRGDLPPLPQDTFGLVSLIAREILIGLMLGLMTRITLSATHTAGSLIAFQTGLAAAQTFDPSQGEQSAIVAGFLTIMAVTLIVITDLHHLLILGMANSYTKFPAGMGIPYTDFAMVIVRYVREAFLTGVQMALPFIVYGIIYNIGLGLVSRMVQGFQVFFISMPVNIYMGFTLMSLLMASMMSLFLERFRELLMDLVG